MMNTDARFLVWFGMFWTIQLGWRVYIHWRGSKATDNTYAVAALTEWIVFITIWLLVLR